MTCERAGERGVLARGKQGEREERAGKAGSQDGAEEFVGVGDFGDVVEAARMKGGGAEHEDRGVDEKSEAEGHGGVEDGVTHGLAAVARGGSEGARLDNAGVEIKVVRHDRGAEDANGDVEHFAVAQNFRAREETDGGFAPERMREEDFVSETRPDRGNQSDDEGFHQAEAAALQGEDEKNVERGDENSGEERQAKEQFQRDGGAKNFGEVASGYRDFADHPKEKRSAV